MYVIFAQVCKCREANLKTAFALHEFRQGSSGLRLKSLANPLAEKLPHQEREHQNLQYSIT